MNSVAIVFGYEPKHRDHPGTTVQTFGAAKLKATYWGESKESILEHVLDNPEAQLRGLSYSLVLGCMLLAGIAGVLVASALQSLAMGFLFQLLLLSNHSIWPCFLRFNPDLPSLALSLLFVSLVLLRPRRQAVYLGVVFGALMATKITCALLGLIPLFLFFRDPRKVVQFGAAALAAFLLCIIPILSKESAAYMAGWVFRLAVHTGKYGEGTVGVPGLGTWVRAVWDLCRAHLIVPAAILLAASSLIRRTSAARNPAVWGLLTALGGTLAVIAKHPDDHYMLAALAPASALLVYFIQSWSPRWQRAAILSALVANAFFFRNYLRFAPVAAVDKVAAPAVTCTAVFDATTGGPPFALRFGDTGTYRRFSAALLSKYPDYLELVGGDHFETVAGSEIPFSAIKKTGKRYCLRSNLPLEELRKYNLPIRLTGASPGARGWYTLEFL